MFCYPPSIELGLCPRGKLISLRWVVFSISRKALISTLLVTSYPHKAAQLNGIYCLPSATTIDVWYQDVQQDIGTRYIYFYTTGCPTIEFSLCFGCFLGFHSSYRGVFYHFSTAQETQIPKLTLLSSLPQKLIKLQHKT